MYFPFFILHDWGKSSAEARSPIVRCCLNTKEALIHSARAGGERFSLSRRFKKRRNTECISRFLNRADGGKDPLPSRRRIIQSFPNIRLKADLDFRE